MRKKSSARSRESALASGWTVEGEAPAEDTYEASADDPAPVDAPESSQVSNATLVLLGVFGGFYLLYSWGWLVIAQAYSEVNAVTAASSGSLGGVLQQIIFWAAPFAPMLWFLTALLVSRGGRTGRLAMLLLIGAVVLLPLPMLIARGG